MTIKQPAKAKSRVKNPLLAFPRCVGCGNPHLSRVTADVHCFLCGWSSMNAVVDAGSLDHLGVAFA